jgi:predicted DNA-binding protein YlxM (UPF0122 family)
MDRNDPNAFFDFLSDVDDKIEDYEDKLKMVSSYEEARTLKKEFTNHLYNKLAKECSANDFDFFKEDIDRFIAQTTSAVLFNMDFTISEKINAGMMVDAVLDYFNKNKSETDEYFDKLNKANNEEEISKIVNEIIEFTLSKHQHRTGFLERAIKEAIIEKVPKARTVIK